MTGVQTCALPISKVEEDGYGVDGIISHLSMKASLRGVRDTSGRPIFVDDMKSTTPYAIGGAPVSFPDNGVMSDPTKLMILGAWNNLVYAIRKDITWKFLDQGRSRMPTARLFTTLRRTIWSGCVLLCVLGLPCRIR